MRLKQIKLAGFKSFVDATQVAFPTPMTCVVGPNGCGKSNVIDAVRWVLGESSAKNLRGDAMTDVIFNGSTQRKPVSQASVELVFENTEGRLQGSLADRSEIAVKRVVTRDAQSLYFLNGSKCRRRDITDIFLGTGLGPRSYAIIEQGMISRLIESRPQELRVFIEEAAGISRYKERRKETETRISHTRDNLERLTDVRDELGKNLEKLKRQSAAAERYKALRASERQLKAELTTLKWYHYNEQLQQASQQLTELETDYQRVLSQDSGSLRQLTELKQQAEHWQSQLDQQQQQYYQLGSDIQLLEQQQLHQRSKLQELSQEQQRLRSELQHQLDEQALAQQQVAEIQTMLLEAQPELQLLESQEEELQQALQQAEQTLQQSQGSGQQLQQQQFLLQQQLRETELQAAYLAKQQQNLREQQTALLLELANAQLPFVTELAALSAQLKWQAAKITELTQQQLLSEQTISQQQQQGLLLQQRDITLTLEQKNAAAQLAVLQQRIIEAAAQQPLLQQLAIEPGWELAVAVALQGLQSAQVLQQPPAVTDGSIEGAALAVDRLNQSGSWLSELSSQPVAGSLATKVQPDSSGQLLVPAYFNSIRCDEELASAASSQSALGAAGSVICRQGHWFGANWRISPQHHERDNVLLLEQQQQALSAQIEQQALKLTSVQAARADNQRALEALTTQQLASAQELQLLQRQQQQGELQQQQWQLQQQHWQQQQAQAKSRQAGINAELATLKAQLDEQAERAQLVSAQLDSQLDEVEAVQQLLAQLQQQVGTYRAQLHALQQQLQQQRLAQVSQERQLDAARMHHSRLVTQSQKITERLHLLTDQLDLLSEPDAASHEELQALLLTREQVAAERLHSQQQLEQVQQHIRQLEQGQQGLQQQLQSRQKAMEMVRLEAEGYRVRANNMLELLREQQVQLKDVLPTIAPDATESALQQQLDNISDSLSRLGPVNLAAIDEYQQQAERKNYLDLQHQDLTAALETLETAIKKIDRETRAKFRSTFDFVNEGLQNLFPKVFGGGSAYLELTGEDLLETGVTIMARPPGKKNSTIHLLSGGEKALTALSLVFSIFRLNPAPFCLLDEVDAPLDDANVGRFCNLVREMSDSVQFIYISHNKIAMEMAAQLMGVTMQEPGVSRVVAVDVEDAVKMAQA